MIKHLLASIAVAFAGTIYADDVSLGSARLALPAGWSVVNQRDDLVSAGPEGGQHQLTLTRIPFDKSLSFDDFKKLCDLRLEGERRAGPQTFVDGQSPFKQPDLFGFLFSGGDRTTKRMFSGYMVFKDGELITLYVESISGGPTEHLRLYSALVQSLKVGH